MADAILAVVTVIGALAYLYADWQLKALTFGDPLGPKVFPALVGLGLLMSGLLLGLETWRKHRRLRPAPTASVAERHHRLILVGMALWTVLYYLAFEPVGYVPATLVYLLGLLAYFNRGRHLVNASVAVGFTAAAYLVFQHFLGVMMPDGVLAML